MAETSTSLLIDPSSSFQSTFRQNAVDFDKFVRWTKCIDRHTFNVKMVAFILKFIHICLLVFCDQRTLELGVNQVTFYSILNTNILERCKLL